MCMKACLLNWYGKKRNVPKTHDDSCFSGVAMATICDNWMTDAEFEEEEDEE